ncbi:MAG: alginate lyase family protein [Pseudomonadota bacterium]
MNIAETWQVARHYSARRIARRVQLRLLRGGLIRASRLLPSLDRRYAPRGSVILAADLLASCDKPACFDIDPAGQQVTLLGQTVELASPVDWTGQGDALSSSHLRRYHLHYMEYLCGVDDAAFERIVRDWIAHNRPFAGARSDAYASYCISIRVMVWLDELKRRRQTLPRSLTVDMTASLVEQVNVMAAFVETDLGGNHLFRNLRTLLWASACLECADASRWRRLALRLLDHELTAQFLPDGFHFERCPAYHGQVMLDLADLRRLSLPMPVAERLDGIYNRAAEAFAWVRHPHGQVSRLGDGLFGQCEAQPPDVDAAEPTATRHFDDAGLVILRAPGELALYDVGAMAPFDLPGHAHADVFTLEWTVNRCPVLVDPGVYEYEATEHRAYARSTPAHNTVSLNGDDQANLHGAFRVGRTPEVQVSLCELSDNGFDVTASHDGWQSRYGVTHERRVAAQPGTLEITDRTPGASRVSAHGHFLFHPDCALRAVCETEVMVEAPGATVRVSASVALKCTTAPYFPQMGERVSAPALRYALADGDTHVRFDVVKDN